ncbi:anti-sigma factor domain-containing protein [Streptomyces sp. NPDC101213]|uniref:anti-sigma factor n=1 Tax=Streptomyces sp. NPDC101213 TaxID=3366130 RepID=UPI00381B2D84
MTSGGDLHLAVGAYVLHALPPAEEAAFEEHLAGCADCRAEMAAHLEIVTRLAGAESASVPPHVRARTLDAISRTTQDRPRRPPEAGHRAGHRAVRFALAASTAAAALLGGVAAWQHSRADDARDRAARADAAGRALTELVTAPDATLHTAALTGGGAAAVVVSRSEARAVFAARDLPALKGDEVYELWYAAEAGGLRPAGLLPGAAERASRVLRGPPAGAVAVGITIEPAGGSRQPTTDPLAVIPLTA